ncbi:hypothetical protein MNV49_007951 [Pseudohyphozyma bogoriensis]|nr:hypothetical protein MNV49_007951 [Pseudohyphozyma bogoriensis]
MSSSTTLYIGIGCGVGVAVLLLAFVAFQIISRLRYDIKKENGRERSSSGFEAVAGNEDPEKSGANDVGIAVQLPTTALKRQSTTSDTTRNSSRDRGYVVVGRDDTEELESTPRTSLASSYSHGDGERDWHEATSYDSHMSLRDSLLNDDPFRSDSADITGTSYGSAESMGLVQVPKMSAITWEETVAWARNGINTGSRFREEF